MLSARQFPIIAGLATAAALILSGCGAAAPPAGPGGASPSGVGIPSDSAGATSTPVTAGATTGGITPTSSAPGAADVAKYTFPDGRLSFEYPADWRVELFTGAGKPSMSRTATVFDAKGAEQVTVYSGQIADGVSHPVRRTVFESEPVAGLSRQPAPAAHYAFYVDRMDGTPTYRMHLSAGAPPAGDGARLDGIIRIGKEVLVADVKFVEKPFASDDAAKDWLDGAEGQALKALLLSVSYS